MPDITALGKAHGVSKKVYESLVIPITIKKTWSFTWYLHIVAWKMAVILILNKHDQHYNEDDVYGAVLKVYLESVTFIWDD